jgi:hypothetical protein
LTFLANAGVRTVLRIGGYLGSERFRATSLQQVSSRSTAGALFNIRSRLSPLFGVDGTFQFVSRQGASDSGLITLVMLVFVR